MNKVVWHNAKDELPNLGKRVLIYIKLNGDELGIFECGEYIKDVYGKKSIDTTSDIWPIDRFNSLWCELPEIPPPQ